MIKLLLAYLLMALLFIGCIPNRNLDQFTVYNKLKKEELSKLKINGIYYRLIPPYLISPYEKKVLVNSFALYNDGTYLSLSCYDDRINLDTIIVYMLNTFSRYKKLNLTGQNDWGAYEIKGDTLHIQGFQGFETQVFYLLDRYYLIKDSVTLERIKVKGSDQYVEEVYDKEELNLFHFYQTDAKPDSTNLFMTKERIKRKLERLYGVKN